MNANIKTETIEIGAIDGKDLKESLPGSFASEVLDSYTRSQIVALILGIRCNVSAEKVAGETVTIKGRPAKIAFVRGALAQLGLVEVVGEKTAQSAGAETGGNTPTPMPTLQERPNTESLAGNATISWLREQGAWDDSWALPAQDTERGRAA